MKTRNISIGLLSLALSCGVGVVAHAQEGPPPYGDRDHDHGGPGLRAGFRAGFDNGRRDFDNHHSFTPERAFHRNGRPEYREEFGPRDEYYRGFHEGFIRGYDRGYRGGSMDDFDHERDHHDDRHDDH